VASDAGWPARAILAALLLLAPLAASAQLIVGASGGIAFAKGDAEKGVAHADELKDAFPIEARVGWRLLPEVEGALYGGWGYGQDGDLRAEDCSVTRAACSSHLWRTGVRGEYAFRGGKYVPFVGLTAGWAWEVLHRELRGGDWDQKSRSGWELGLELGVDMVTSKRFALGLFVGGALGQYVAVRYEGKALGDSFDQRTSIRDGALHGWLLAGLRGTFEFAVLRGEPPAMEKVD
jgi:opacity protein-like surface antigen